MKNILTITSLCLIQFIFGNNVFAQKFELTPTIPVQGLINKSALKFEKLSNTIGLHEITPSAKILTLTSSSQLNYSWGKYLSASYNDRFYKTIIDVFGNVIAVGSKGYSTSDIDAVIYKFDSFGNILWSNTVAASSSNDAIYNITTDNSGNIYITGQFNSSAFIDNIYSYGNADMFVAKYDASGTLLWARNAGGSNYDYGSGIALDNAGNVYVVGFFNGDGYWDGLWKTSSAQGDMFIAKYDNNGNVKWVRNGDVGEYNYLFGIGVDKTGNVYVSANFTGSIQFEGAPIVSSNGGEDMFLIKYDNTGSYKWIKTTGGNGDDGGNDTRIDADGNILVAGYFSNVAQFENKTLTAHGTYDIFSSKYSPNGNLIWVKQFGGNGSQSAWAITSDEKNNCYLTGWFSGTGAFDNTTIISSGGLDAYLIKYDKNGNLIWVEPTAAGLEKQVGTGLSVKANDIAIAGYYEGEMNIQGSTFPNSGGEDAYFAKLIQSDAILPNFIVNPTISLSSPQIIKPGQSITITGNQFSPVGKIDILFSGPESLPSVIDLTIDLNGFFQYTITTSLSIAIGDYNITAIDKISGKRSSRKFRIIQDQTLVVDNDLIITEPNMSNVRYMNEPITLAWEDKIKYNINTLYNNKYSYSVSVQKDNGAWVLVTNIEGINPDYGNLNLSTNYTPTQQGKYKLKVVDNYYPNRSSITPEITIEYSIFNDINIEFLWDTIYPVPLYNNNPVGVAADGVARFYMVVSNKASLGSAIQKVKITLSDPEKYMSPQFLGKVKYCFYQSVKYSTDGNDSKLIESENNTTNVDGKYWFWYVAPNDFARNLSDSTLGERIIYANFDITLLNEQKYSIALPISIVRPPLLLVHGLNGDFKNTWEDFRVGTEYPIYSNDSRFKVKNALHMLPKSHFSDNSKLLLGDLKDKNNNSSFMYSIDKLRELGYACNQVDYVCHSMGGSMLRDAAENEGRYYRECNYKRGFIHKFISLDTPHQGSTLANVLDDATGNYFTTHGLLGINPLVDFYDESTHEITDAVSDLRYKGGIKFRELNIHSHLIGGGSSCNDFGGQTTAIYFALKVLVLNDYSVTNLCNWYSSYFDSHGYESNFMEGSDAIVSFNSQFSETSIDPFPSNCTMISGIMHNSKLGLSPTKAPDVFNKVNKLLNSDVSSTEFHSIPATPVVSSKSSPKQNKNTLAVLENKISILYPSEKLAYNADDTITIKLIADTTGLKSIAVYFQDQSIYTNQSDSMVVINLTVNPEYIEGQSIIAIANYEIAGQMFIASDYKEITVNPVGDILEFNVRPELVVIQKGKSAKPDYEAVFPNAISLLGITDLFSVSINNPNLLSYNQTTNGFNGLQEGITNATMTYRGKSRTVFFEILEPKEPPIDPITWITQFEKNNQLNIKTYPIPFTDKVTFEYSRQVSGETSLEIFNIYGQKVCEYHFDLQLKGTNCESVDLSRLPSGVYVYKSTSGAAIQNGIIVKN